MLEMIVTWSCFALIFFGIRYFRKKYKKRSIDLSLGSVEIREIREAIANEQFDAAELLIFKLKPDELTQALDCVGLTITTPKLMKWLESSKNAEIISLFLGVHYNHLAWISRTHAYSRFVSEKKQNEFFDYQSKSSEYLEAIPHDSNFIGEVHSRLIRVNMGDYGFSEEASESFEKAIMADDKQLWPYLHYCEVIQPKWGGDKETIAHLLESLPNVPLIKHTVKLKLILDSFIISENYFGGMMYELKNAAKEEIIKIDSDLDDNPIDSIHRFILFNYMKLVAEQVDNNQIEKKYSILSKKQHTLYPYGVMI